MQVVVDHLVTYPPGWLMMKVSAALEPEDSTKLVHQVVPEVVDMVAAVPEDPEEALVEAPVEDNPEEAMVVDLHPCPPVLQMAATNHQDHHDHHLHPVVSVAEMSIPIRLQSWKYRPSWETCIGHFLHYPVVA